MILWRISNYADLGGIGGLRAAARWHSAGAPVVYTANAPASALLEVLVHLEFAEPDDLPSHYRLLKIDVPANIHVVTVPANTLPADWRNQVHATRAIGDAWLRAKSSALLAVPSALVPDTDNFLLNPRHADAQKIKIVATGSYPFDFRLFR